MIECCFTRDERLNSLLSLFPSQPHLSLTLSETAPSPPRGARLQTRRAAPGHLGCHPVAAPRMRVRWLHRGGAGAEVGFGRGRQSRSPAMSLPFCFPFSPAETLTVVRCAPGAVAEKSHATARERIESSLNKESGKEREERLKMLLLRAAGGKKKTRPRPRPRPRRRSTLSLAHATIRFSCTHGNL